MVTSFLMVGQSNMAGRGNPAEVKKIVHGGKLLMLRNCKWLGMAEPINYDRPFSGTSLAASFDGRFAVPISNPSATVVTANTAYGCSDFISNSSSIADISLSLSASRLAKRHSISLKSPIIGGDFIASATS